MNLQATARWIDEQTDDVYRAVFHLCDVDPNHDGDSAAAVAHAASRAAFAELVRQHDCPQLNELYAQLALRAGPSSPRSPKA